MKKMLRPAGIIGTGSFLPERIITNNDLEKMIDTSDEWIVSRTGISERRWVSDDLTTSEMGAKAAQKALEAAGLTAEEIDLIIVATITPDMYTPSTACLVQQKIGAVNAAAFDLSAACTGFIYALSLANSMIASGVYKNILVIGSESLSKMLNPEDRNTLVIFGDGAGAAVVSQVEENKGFLAFDLGSDGSGGDLLFMEAVGMREAINSETEKKHYLKMKGNEVFKFAVRVMGETSLKALAKVGLTNQDIDYLVPHQANIRIVDSAVRRLKLPPEKVYINLDKCGNMSGASIPVALDEAIRKGKVNKDDVLVLVGFGAGLTWGSCVMRWS